MTSRPGVAAKSLRALVDRELLLGLDQDALAVAVAHRSTDAGRADTDRVVAEDFLGLVDHLHLFRGIAGVLLGTDLWNQIERNRMSKSRRSEVGSVERCARAVDQLALAGNACTAGRLVGANHHPTYARCLVQWLHGQNHLRRAAVGASDYALVFTSCFGIDLGDHERDFGVHAPVARLVNNNAAGLFGPGDKILGHGVGRAANCQVDTVEDLWREFLDRVGLATEFDCAASRSGRSEEADVLVRKLAFSKQSADNSAYGACGTDNGNGLEHGGCVGIEVKRGPTDTEHRLRGKTDSVSSRFASGYGCAKSLAKGYEKRPGQPNDRAEAFSL